MDPQDGVESTNTMSFTNTLSSTNTLNSTNSFDCTNTITSELPHAENVFEIRERWQDALDYCERELGSEDFELIMRYKSHDEMLSAIEEMQRDAGGGSVPRLLRQFKPRILQLKTFTFGIAVGVGTESIQTACFWGVATLMLELAVRSEEVLSEITAMWADIGNSLQIFEAYKEFIDRDVSLQEALFDVLVELLLFGVFTIKTIKFMKVYPGYSLLSQLTTWPNVRNKFRDTSERISQRIRFIKEKSEASRLLHEEERRSELMKYLAMQAREDSEASRSLHLEETVTLPCFYVPYPVNPNFYGREDILSSVEERLRPMSNPTSLLSTALWAAAGMGKTQIALEYANRQRQRGVQAIFWISSEALSESAKSFTEIAQILDLVGATNSKGHDQNRLLVLQWLQQTKTPWLLIFDNVEDQALLKQMWPSCGSGSILVTCRSELLAASSAATSVEVPAFSDPEGGALLLQELGLQSYSKEELAISIDFSNTLGGHALAIDIMARHMRSRKKSLEKFVQVYKANPRSMYKNPKRGIINIYYDKDLESMWLFAFSQLDTLSSRVFGILCLLASERVPATVFSTKLASDLLHVPENEFEDVIVDLMGLSLVRANEGLGYLSVHRLIQGEFRAQMNPELQRKRFAEAAILLHETFPQQKKGFTLFKEWLRCESLIEHVQALCDRYQEFADDPELVYMEDFVMLCSDAGRYLWEIGRYNGSMQVTKAAALNCKDQNSIPYSNLCINIAAIYEEKGRSLTAQTYNEQALKIRRTLLPHGHSEIANALSNYAHSIICAGGNMSTALGYLHEALEINMLNPKEDRDKVLHLRHYNICYAFKAMGYFAKARQEVDTATRYVEAEFGKESRYLNITYRILSDLMCEEGLLEEAFQYTLKALAIAQKEASTTPWVSACLYRAGCIRLKQGMAGEAHNHLEQALLITQLNEREKGDRGDTARVLSKIADALSAKCEWEESENVRLEAEQIYEDLIQTGHYTRSPSEEDRFEYLVCLKFR